MPVIDDIRESQGKLKGKGFKYKFSYFWDYYRIPTLIVILVGIFLFSIIKTVVTAKDTEFEAIFMNAVNIPSEEDFAAKVGIDLDKYDVLFDNSYMMSTNVEVYDETTYTNAQKLMAVIASGMADVMLGDPAIIENYADAQIYADLRDYYSEEFLNSLGDKVIYHTPVDSETGEAIGAEIPYAINVGDSTKLSESLCYYTDDVYLTIIVNTKHPDYVRAFYEYLYE